MRNVRAACLIGITVSAFCAPGLFAQAPETSWTRTYGGTETDKAWSVQQTTDGGYIMAGYTESYGAGYQDAYLLKTDSSGDTLWTRTFGGATYDYGFSAQQTTDGGYILSGWTWSYGPGYYDVYLIKTDSSGDTLWTRTYGSPDPNEWEKGYSIQQTADGGYIIAGCTEMGAGSYDVLLVKTDSSGDTDWIRTYGGADEDKAWSVQQTLDGGYIIAGFTESAGAGSYDVWLIKTNSSGDILWTETYGGAGADYGYSVQQTTDSGYIIAGRTESFGAGSSDVWLIKTTSSGDTLWAETYGGTGADAGHSVQQTLDGGYIISGYTETGVSYDAWLVRTDSSGGVLWTETYGDAGMDVGYAVQQTTDGGYAIAGYTTSYGAGSYDVYLIKTEPESAGIAEDQIQVANQPFINFRISPNPFSATAEIRFQTADTGGEVDTYCSAPVTLNIYDMRGRLVRSFLPFSSHLSHIHSVLWDGRNNSGTIITSGIYYCRLSQGNYTETKKVLFVN
ncbi:MAG: T9SS type A sorting domain-containing protein [Candidatus Sabulitectum sp.]|nr:T9SS type A sorting domain-containing protein [Candidatus Sabulitectum sp.]